MSTPQTRSPAPRANAGNRAEVTRNETSPSILTNELEADFAALLVARRHQLATPLAWAVVTLAGLGRTLA